MNILAVGDVVSDTGCEFLKKKLPAFKRVKGIDFCIVNGENSAVGNGITPHSAKEIFDAGADVITTGNHVFRRKEVYTFLDENRNIVRPANYYANSPGRGICECDLGYTRVAVMNLSGQLYMESCDNPFEAADRLLAGTGCKIILADFHAEATAEKGALGYYLDGRVSAVFGTHTHVQTSDARVLPGGTGFITDLGMTGVRESVLGVKPELSIARMRTGMPVRFEAAQGEAFMCGCIFEIDEKTGKCLGTETVCVE